MFFTRLVLLNFFPGNWRSVDIALATLKTADRQTDDRRVGCSAMKPSYR